MSDFSSQHQKKNGSGNHPNSIAAGTKNLFPYKPGQSGNPGGRPKGTQSIEHAIYRLLAFVLTMTCSRRVFWMPFLSQRGRWLSRNSP